jgi:hypothetical protein
MLAIVLIGLLIADVLTILAGWALDRADDSPDVGDACPLFPPPYQRDCTSWEITPPDRGGRADRSRSWTSRGFE